MDRLLASLPPAQCWSALYLTTGVLVSLLSQHVVSCPHVDPRLHVIPAAKWMSTLAVSIVSHLSGPISPPSDDRAATEGRPRTRTRTRTRTTSSANARDATATKATKATKATNATDATDATDAAKVMMTLVLGVLDCTAYLFFCLGFARCGAAASAVVLPAMGHVLTAVFSVTLLRNRLSVRRWWAVGLVLVGVLAKGWDVDFEGHAYVRVGFGYLALAALCYSTMGAVYETVVRWGVAPRHATITLWSSGMGTAGWVGYYCWYWYSVRSSDGSPLALGVPEGLGAWGVPLAAFVCVYNVHVYVQGMTFRADGAMGVQLVNAVRGWRSFGMSDVVIDGDRNEPL